MAFPSQEVVNECEAKLDQSQNSDLYFRGIPFRGFSECEAFRRYLQLERSFLNNASIAAAALAGILDDLPRATALRAGTSDAEETLLKANLAITVAG